jgi:hypothetical protein
MPIPIEALAHGLVCRGHAGTLAFLSKHQLFLSRQCVDEAGGRGEGSVQLHEYLRQTHRKMRMKDVLRVTATMASEFMSMRAASVTKVISAMANVMVQECNIIPKEK